MKGWKKIILNTLGIITTAGTLAIIYLILFMTGTIKELTTETVIEYIILLILALSTKSFWYASVENSIRTSKQYEDTINNVVSIMNEEVTDTYDFDRFIHYENINNYNTYILNRCIGLTVNNYRYRWYDRLEIIIRWIFKRKKPKHFYAERYVKYVTYRATKIHKLSSANILTFRESAEGLIDDRNPARKQKFIYLIGGSVTSAALMFTTAIMSFTMKDSINMRATIIKMLMYSVQILTAILQTILNAHVNVSKGDSVYFRRLINIFNKN